MDLKDFSYFLVYCSCFLASVRSSSTRQEFFVPYPQQFQQQNQPPQPVNFPGSGPNVPYGAPMNLAPLAPYLTVTTPVPYQSLEVAQPITLPSQGGFPTWIARYLLLRMIQQNIEGTTTPTTTAATPYTFPAIYSDWYEFGNCRYQSESIPTSWDVARTTCAGKGARLATINVKQSSTRNAIFAETDLAVYPAWIGLEDSDGPTSTTSGQWIDFAIFLPDSTTTYTTTAGTRSCAKASTTSGISFTNCDTEMQRYLCEFCPSLHM